MSGRWLVPSVALLLLFGCCSICIWSMQKSEEVFWSHEFDLGGGRVLHVWSSLEHEPFETHSPAVYYRIDEQGRELVHTTYLGSSHDREFDFQTVTAENGKLACVYERSLATTSHSYLLMFDSKSAESWPRVRDNETTQVSFVIAKWKERHKRLKAANPDLPSPPPFDE